MRQTEKQSLAHARLRVAAIDLTFRRRRIEEIRRAAETVLTAFVRWRCGPDAAREIKLTDVAHALLDRCLKFPYMEGAAGSIHAIASFWADLEKHACTPLRTFDCWYFALQVHHTVTTLAEPQLAWVGQVLEAKARDPNLSMTAAAALVGKNVSTLSSNRYMKTVFEAAKKYKGRTRKHTLRASE